MAERRFMAGFAPVKTGRVTERPAQETMAKGAAQICIGYVHLDALCWTFFRYHLLIKAAQQGIVVLDRPVSTLKEQIAEIDSLLREQIDVLMLRPVASENSDLLAVVQRARALGVEVITLDGSLGGGLDITTVSVDNVGGQAGITDYVCQRLQGKGRIAHLQGNQNMETGKLRTHGLHSVLARYPGIELTHEVELDWGSPIPLRTQGETLARRVLAERRALDAIICTSDESAFGVHDALLDLGLQDQVLITGFDALPEALIAIDDGRMEASVHQPLEMMAERALHDAVRLVRKEPGLATHTCLAADTITKSNLLETSLRALRLFPSVISELNERRSQQQATASFLETLIENLPDILFVKDAQSLAYVRRNRAADEWLGVSPGSFLGKTAFDSYPDEIAFRFQASDRAILANGLPVDIPEELSFLRDRGTRYMHTQKVPIFDTRGKPVYLMGILQDITDQKAAEMALAQQAKDLEQAIETLEKDREKLVATEKMAALGSLVAGVAHELNTPIGNGLLAATTLLDSTRILAEKFASGLSRSMLTSYLADAADGAEMLERNLHRAADLINSFKQIAIDQSSTQVRRFSLATVVSEVLLTLMPTLKKTPFTVTQSVPDTIVLDSYPGPLEQVLINLINNAVIHGLSGCASGQISISACLPDSDRVQLVVEDNGKGIPDEQLQKVFTPFYTTKADAGGSGLGLSITHSIVTGLLGGEIKLTSTVGAGTRFCITIPLAAKSR